MKRQSTAKHESTKTFVTYKKLGGFFTTIVSDDRAESFIAELSAAGAKVTNMQAAFWSNTLRRYVTIPE